MNKTDLFVELSEKWLEVRFCLTVGGALQFAFVATLDVLLSSVELLCPHLEQKLQ